MEKENNKKKVSILIGAIVVVLVLIVGITYAYLSSNNKTPANSVKSGTLLISYEDDNLNSIRLENISPIYDKDIKEKASKISFQVNNTGTAKAYVDINITDISLPNELADLEFKWALYSGDEKISNGNFRNVLDNKLLLTNNEEIESTKNKSYELYIWISESELNQSDMMEKTFTGKITINGNQNKQPELLSKVIKDNNPVNNKKPDLSKNAVSQEYYDTLTESTHPKQSEAVVESGLFKTNDDDGDTYYFRGHVENNYVKIEGLKWLDDMQSTYTNDTFGFTNSSLSLMEMVCNSIYSSYGYQSGEECIDDIIEIPGHKKDDDILFKIIRINGDGTIRLVTNNAAVTGNWDTTLSPKDEVVDLGYTYKTITGYEIGEKSKEEFSSEGVKFNNEENEYSSTESYYYADSFTFDKKNGGYTLTNPVAHTGIECNNDKSLCEGKYTQFSISTSKNNELYQVTTVESEANIKYYAYEYVGKAILDPNGEDIDNPMKTTMDNWYNQYMTNYDKILANTRYCNDTTTPKIGKNGELQYGAYVRIKNDNPEPSFICPNTDKLYGGEYDLKIGLLSADEVSFAGIGKIDHNKDYYLYENHIISLLMSPAIYGYNAMLYSLESSMFGNIASTISRNQNPVLNLRADTPFTEGNGTKDQPYIVSID